MHYYPPNASIDLEEMVQQLNSSLTQFPQNVSNVYSTLSHGMFNIVITGSQSWGSIILLFHHYWKRTSLMTNSRPISIVPVFSKILEKVVNKQLHNYLSLHHLYDE